MLIARNGYVMQYVNFLTPDVDFTMGLKSIKGHAAVKDFRKGMWNGVASRLHKPKKAYSLDEKASEVMLFGTVEYGLDSGKSATVEWAARMVFAPSSEQLKLASYQVSNLRSLATLTICADPTDMQVWLDSTPLKEAMAAK